MVFQLRNLKEGREDKLQSKEELFNLCIDIFILPLSCLLGIQAKISYFVNFAFSWL
jgi:hypothetical protein